MAIAISEGTWKRRSTKPSRTPFRRPIRFQPSSRRRAGAPAVPDPFIQRGRYDPKAPGIIKFFQANEVLRREKREERRETRYHTCPLGADVAAAARILPPRPSALCRGCARAGRGGAGQ